VLSAIRPFNDMPAGSNFVREMQRGLSQSARFIALLSPAYQRSDHCQAEWSAAYNADPGGQKRKLVPFLIGPANLDPLAKQIVFKSLVGLSPSDAAKAVLEAVGYRGLPPAVPTGWPGGAAIHQMRVATGGVYDVAPGSDLRLERMPGAINDAEDGGHTAEQPYTDAVSVVVRFSDYVERSSGNYRCGDRLTARVRNLSRGVVGIDVRHCDRLEFNREWV
jgi:TIR domain